MVDRAELFGGLLLLLLAGSLVGLGYIYWAQYAKQQAERQEIKALVEKYKNREEPGTENRADTLDRAGSNISIYSSPADAQLIVDGVVVGSTPISYVSDILDSTHIVLQKDGYISVDTVVSSKSVTGDSLLFSLKESQVPREDTSINGTETENVSVDYGSEKSQEVFRSENTQDAGITSDSERRSPEEGRITPQDGGTDTSVVAETSPRPSKNDSSTGAIEGQLTNPQGKMSILQVLVKPWGSIFIDGDLHKMDTDVIYTTEQPQGTHRLRVHHPVLGTLKRSVDLSRDSVLITVDFEQATQLLIRSQPPSAEVYLNGRATAFYTPIQLMVPPGQHVVDVMKNNRTSVSGPQEVTVERGKIDSLSFSLSPDGSL